jgi:hypothetical protein
MRFPGAKRLLEPIALFMLTVSDKFPITRKALAWLVLECNNGVL